MDGALLLSFEWQDYVDLGFTQSHVIKRVLLQIEKRAFFKSHRDLPVTFGVEIKFQGAFDLHAIDATPARWRGDAGSSPLDGVSTTRHTG